MSHANGSTLVDLSSADTYFGSDGATTASGLRRHSSVTVVSYRAIRQEPPRWLRSV